MFNFKDDIGMKKFYEATSNNEILSSIFDSKKSVNIQCKKFLKRFNGILHQCFKKIKITPNTKKEKEINELYKQQKNLKFKTDTNSIEELQRVNEKLVDKLSEDLFGIVKDEVSKINSETGGFNSGHLWQLKKKLSGKRTNSMAAVLDKCGNLVTQKEQIKDVTMDQYKKV